MTAETHGRGTPGPWFARQARADELHDGEEPYWIVLATDPSANEGDALVCSVNALSGEDAFLLAASHGLYEAAKRFIPPNVCLTNSNIPDDLVIPLDVTMGELRSLATALAKAETGR
jgi:hypothetical protein